MNDFNTETKYRIEDVAKHEYHGYYFELEDLKRILKKLREKYPDNEYIVWRMTIITHCDKMDW